MASSVIAGSITGSHSPLNHSTEATAPQLRPHQDSVITSIASRIFAHIKALFSFIYDCALFPFRLISTTYSNMTGRYSKSTADTPKALPKVTPSTTKLKEEHSVVLEQTPSPLAETTPTSSENSESKEGSPVVFKQTPLPLVEALPTPSESGESVEKPDTDTLVIQNKASQLDSTTTPLPRKIDCITVLPLFMLSPLMYPLYRWASSQPISSDQSSQPIIPDAQELPPPVNDNTPSLLDSFSSFVSNSNDDNTQDPLPQRIATVIFPIEEPVAVTPLHAPIGTYFSDSNPLNDPIATNPSVFHPSENVPLLPIGAGIVGVAFLAFFVKKLYEYSFGQRKEVAPHKQNADPTDPLAKNTSSLLNPQATSNPNLSKLPTNQPDLKNKTTQLKKPSQSKNQSQSAENNPSPNPKSPSNPNLSKPTTTTTQPDLKKTTQLKEPPQPIGPSVKPTQVRPQLKRRLQPIQEPQKSNSSPTSIQETRNNPAAQEPENNTSTQLKRSQFSEEPQPLKPTQQPQEPSPSALSVQETSNPATQEPESDTSNQPSSRSRALKTRPSAQEIFSLFPPKTEAPASNNQTSQKPEKETPQDLIKNSLGKKFKNVYGTIHPSYLLPKTTPPSSNNSASLPPQPLETTPPPSNNSNLPPSQEEEKTNSQISIPTAPPSFQEPVLSLKPSARFILPEDFNDSLKKGRKNLKQPNINSADVNSTENPEPPKEKAAEKPATSFKTLISRQMDKKTLKQLAASANSNQNRNSRNSTNSDEWN